MKGNLKISVSKNMMYVIARVDPNGDEDITTSYVKNKLEELGVRAGIAIETIRDMVYKQQYEKEFVIAEGKEPTPGKDGYYSFFFKTETKEYQPTILDDGSVDYSIQREFVKEGDLLAKYYPAQPGVFGYTVFANVVAPLPAKDFAPLQIRGVVKKEMSYYAETDGEVSYDNGVLTVDNVLLIKENATNTTGFIHYIGDIHVCGDVLSGTTISAEGNIIVDGAVEAAFVTATKDIIIRKGIFGTNKAIIKAEGSVHTTIIEEAEVIAGEDITLYYSYCSSLTAKRDILADTMDGKLIGGVISAGNSIQAKSAGNIAEVRTRLRIYSEAPKIDSHCKIVILKESFRGVELVFGERIVRNVDEIGEYHFIDEEIHRYRLNSFRDTKQKKPVVDIDKPTILLVDDQPVVLKTFYTYLYANYNVLAVNSARDAFTLMESVIPDLILLDYKMPIMDGGEMLEKMRNDTTKRYHDVPVIFVTAVADKEIVTKCLLLYPQGYLIKPLKKEELLEVVNNFFSRSVVE